LLQVLIEEHNNMYIQLFKKKLKPKARHLIHYPRIMKACGPLVYLWCMTFETKHKESRATATSTSSKRNIATAIVFKHQLKLQLKQVHSYLGQYFRILLK
ncbi:hypothetical protein ALC57_01173, partial [Trachymyrmex cornetzi]